MKSMEEYIDEVYKKYEEAEKNHIVYKKVKMKRSNPWPVLCSVAACLVVALLVYSNLNDVKPNPDNEEKFVSSEVEENGRKVYSLYLKHGEHNKKKYLEDLILNSNYIMIVSNYTDFSVENVYNHNKLIIRTIGNFQVDDILKGQENLKNPSIKCMKYGGIIPLLEIEKEIGVDWKEWEKIYLGETIRDDEKDNVYVKQEVENGCELEEGKQYLVFMNYNEKEDYYEFTHIAYGIMEYDPVTNMVKNIETGEFEEFDWDLITEQ